MSIIVEQLWPANEAPGEWKKVGHATTWNGAKRIAQREYNPESFGGLRHPDGGPLYGTLRAVDNEGKVYTWEYSDFQFTGKRIENGN